MTINFSSQPNLLYNLTQNSAASQLQTPSQAANSIMTQQKPEKMPEKEQNSLKTPLIIGTIALAALGCYLGRGKIKEFLGLAEKNAKNIHDPKPNPTPSPVQTPVKSETGAQATTIVPEIY